MNFFIALGLNSCLLPLCIIPPHLITASRQTALMTRGLGQMVGSILAWETPRRVVLPWSGFKASFNQCTGNPVQRQEASFFFFLAARWLKSIFPCRFQWIPGQTSLWIRLEASWLGLWPRVKPFQMSLRFLYHMIWLVRKRCKRSQMKDNLERQKQKH